MLEPEAYAKNHDLQTLDVIDFLDEHLGMERIHEGDMVLDIGSGDGGITKNVLLPRLLTKNVKKLIGNDCSREMIALARATHTHPQLEFQQFNICDSPDNLREKINHVFSFFCINWIRDQRKAFENVYNVLTQNGDVLMTCYTYHPGSDALFSVARNPKWRQYMHDLMDITPAYQFDTSVDQRVQKILTDLGFKVRVCRLVDREFTYNNYDHWKNSVTVIPFVKRVPSNLVDEYIMDIFCEHKKFTDSFTVNDNGSITIKYKNLILSASKC